MLKIYCELCGIQNLLEANLGRCKVNRRLFKKTIFKLDDKGDHYAKDLMCEKCHLVIATVYSKEKLL